MDSIDAKSLETMVKMMRKHGVAYLRTPQVELRLTAPLPEERPEPPAPKRNLTPQEQFAQPFFKL